MFVICLLPFPSFEQRLERRVIHTNLRVEKKRYPTRQSSVGSALATAPSTHARAIDQNTTRTRKRNHPHRPCAPHRSRTPRTHARTSPVPRAEPSRVDRVASPRSPQSSPNRRARAPRTRTNASPYARTHTHRSLTRRDDVYTYLTLQRRRRGRRIAARFDAARIAHRARRHPHRRAAVRAPAHRRRRARRRGRVCAHHGGHHRRRRAP